MKTLSGCYCARTILNITFSASALLALLVLAQSTIAAQPVNVLRPTSWETSWIGYNLTEYPSGATPTAVCSAIKSAYEDGNPPVFYNSGIPEPPATGDACSDPGGYITSSFTATLIGQSCQIENTVSYCGEMQEPFVHGNHPVSGECPSGFSFDGGPSGLCIATEDPVTPTPAEPGPNLGLPQDCPVGNPINPANGNKLQIEYDYYSGTLGTLPIFRTYNSLATSNIPSALQEPEIIGARWHFSLDMRAIVRSIDITDETGYIPVEYSVSLIRPDGRRLEFWVETDEYGEIQFTSTLRGKHNRLESVELLSASSLAYFRDDGAIEYYELTHTDGDLTWMVITEIEYLDGKTAEFTYDGNDRLISVDQSPGADYSISYDGNGRVDEITVPSGYLTYSYDSDDNFASVVYPDSNDRSYLYEDTEYPNALTGITDENNVRFATFEYDEFERGILSKHAGDTNLFTFSYLGDYETEVTDPYEQTITFQHLEVNGEALRNAVSSLSATCTSNVLEKDFDEITGQLIAEYDAYNSLINSYVYSNNDHTVEVTNAEAVTTTFNFLDSSRPESIVTDETEIEFEYDVNGRLSTKTITDLNTSDDQVWSYTYTTEGRLATINGPRTDVSDITTFTYHTTGELESVTNALSQTTEYDDYTDDGRVGTVTEPSGIVTEFVYTARGWIDTITRAGLETVFDYDAVGNLTQVTYPDGSTVEYTYDDAHRLIKITDHDGNEMVFTLDAAGNRIGTEIYKPGPVLVFGQNQTFTTAGRLQSVIGSLNQTTEYEYDDNGNVVSITDPLNHETSFQLDALGREVTAIDGYYSTATSKTYDPGNGLVASIDDYNQNETTYDYNGLLQLVELVSPDTGTTVYDYDDASNLVGKIDADGRDLGYSYDALNRLLTISGTGYSVEFGYDEETNSIGQLGSMEDSAGDTKWLYNNLGLIAEKEQTPTGASALTTTYTYDAYARLDEVEYPSGHVVAYNYGANGKVSSVEVDSSTLISGITYFPFGPVVSWDASNDEDYIRTFNTDGLISSITYPDTVRSYTYDAAYRITEIEDSDDSSQTETMTYEPMGRLESFTQDSVTTEWAYDANGVRYEETRGTLYRTYTSSANRIEDIYRNDLSATEFDYAYDYAGNRTAKDDFDYYYDESGRLIEVQDNSTTIAEYEYNGLGQRVTKVANSVTTYYVYDEQRHLLGEYPSTGPSLEYVWLGDTPVAMIQTGTGTSVFHIYPDHLNTPRFLANAGGTVVWTWDSDAFGNGLPDEDPDNNSTDVTMNLRFPGQMFDAETGTHYNYFRDYDPVLGVYLQSDPIGLAGGLNTYGYVSNNPLSYTDSTGQFIDTIFDVGFVAYDAFRILRDNVFGNCGNFGENLTALGVDAISIFVPGVTGSGVAVRGVARGGGRTLYRAVGPDELADIQAAGRYRVPAGRTEGKYFFETPEQASNFARMIGDQPYTTTSVRISPSQLGGGQPINPAGEGPGYFFSTPNVPSGPVTIFNYSVLP